MSAFPAHRDGDGWRRSCNLDPIEGFVASVLLVGRGSDDALVPIGPGDTVEGGVVNGNEPHDVRVTRDTLAVHIACIQPASASDEADCSEPETAVDASALSYREPAIQSNSHNVILLIDGSGSVSGLVDANKGYRENDPSRFELPANPLDLASDRLNARFTVLRSVLARLGRDDHAGLVVFGEGLSTSGLWIPCAAALGVDVAAGLAACYGTDRAVWFDDATTSAPRGSGRSNLWTAIQMAYEFLARSPRGDPTATNDIIVFTDGPDTCGTGEAMTPCARSCNSVDAAVVLDRIKRDLADPASKPIRIHSVQFESHAYPGRDLRQVDVACESGGHYQFINSSAFERSSDALRESLDLAGGDIAMALSGHWEIASAVPDFASDHSMSGGLARGQVYTIAGRVDVRSEAGFGGGGVSEIFDVGTGTGVVEATAWDRRLSIVKRCRTSSDCASQTVEAPCTVACSAETGLCHTPSLVLPDGTMCGATQACCSGACISSLESGCDVCE
ncbi:MAG: VWA domain-containing protein [Phycisphaerales bacterium]|nr:VWA domain-containing protein [Phycisphaerales bacterium]